MTLRLVLADWFFFTIMVLHVAVLFQSVSCHDMLKDHPRVTFISQAKAPHNVDTTTSRSLSTTPSNTIMIGEELPTNVSIRYPAEYEAVASVLLTNQSWSDEAFQIINTLIEHTDVDIFMAGDPDDIVNHVDFFPLAFPVDSIWVRDFGPVGVLVNDSEEEEESLALINMRYRHYLGRLSDNHFPCEFASLYDDWPCYSASLIMDGGNLMSDGEGNLFTTTRTYDWNYPTLSKDQVDDLLRQYLGVTTIHALDYAKYDDGYPMDGTGHIDMFAKLMGPCKVMVAETTSPIFRRVTLEAAEYFSNLACGGNNSTYQVYRTPAWSAMYEDPNFEEPRLIWYTYTNSLIVNDVILVPGFATGNDTEAAAVYQEASPNGTVLVINMDGPILWAGAIHCMTRQLPAAAANSPSKLNITLPNDDEEEEPTYREYLDFGRYCAGVAWTMFPGNTLFAPTDEVLLEYWKEKGWEEWWLGPLCDVSSSEVTNLIVQYIVEGTFLLNDLLNLPGGDVVELKNLMGGTIIFNKTSLTVNGTAKIIDADAARDGFVLHGINGMLLESSSMPPTTPAPTATTPAMAATQITDMPTNSPTSSASSSSVRGCSFYWSMIVVGAIIPGILLLSI